ncbi:MAG: kinase/pyrophosphorylase [Nitratireductor sp.]|nr:kinase/pyrophosphorylase [Nitratireductor sp.]MCB1456357.1 kinase/pyrophosphorylase [Nitratireductor sp.]MCB1460116.1 kinase/pyrophosphorylase [Nitratireductor sp.]
MTEQFFHLHLISDATGETLMATSRAVTSQYKQTQAIEHVYPLVRSRKQMDSVLASIDREPGMVLYTITDTELGGHLEERCRSMGIPCVSILEPIFQAFKSYLGMPSLRKVGAQHELNAEYFSRIDALNFTMMHDDGALPENIEDADIILIGISRTSKTPTSIYLANRGIKTANVPLVPGIEPPAELLSARRPLVVALIASTDRIFQVRQNRILGLSNQNPSPGYVDRATIAEELAQTRKLCARHGWPLIDVSRKSIEETAAAIIALKHKHTAAMAGREHGL